MPQPLVSAAAAAGAAVAAAGSGDGQTGGHLVAACPTQGAASWGWISAERPPLTPDSRERREKSTFSDIKEIFTIRFLLIYLQPFM